MDELNCTVCREQFDENNHIPRTLRCGHTCCGPCLAVILSGRREHRLCPECRQMLRDNQVSQYPTSITILRLVRALTGVSNPTRVPGTEAAALGNCVAHGSPLSWRCLTCNDWMCNTCRSTHRNRGMPCTIISVQQALPMYKQSQVDSIERAIDDANEIKTSNETEGSKVSQTIQKLLIAKRKIDERVIQANNWITILEGYEAQVVEAPAGTSVERAVEESHKLCMEFNSWKGENSQIESINSSISQVENGMPVPFEDLRLRMLQLKKIYSKINTNPSRVAWAQLTVDSDAHKFLLHSASAEQPPSGATVIPWSSIKQNMQDSNQLCFFDIEWNGRFEGRVYLRMFEGTPRGNQFVLLCTGEAGPYYRGTRLFSEENSTLIRGGDWEFGDLSGGRTATSNIQIHDGGVYKQKVFPGLLSGMFAGDTARLSQFTVDLKHGHGQQEECAFGRVENGLAVLKMAIKVMPGAIPVITDCGLVMDI